MMTFDKKTLFSLLISFYIINNLLQFYHVNFLYITTIMSFCSYVVLPGFLILLVLRIKKKTFWEYILFIIGFSIAFLEFGGLLLNILFPLFGIKDPLTLQNIVFVFDIYIFLLSIFAWIRTKPFVLQLQFPKRSRTEKVLYIIPLFFPLLATLGTIMLNNGGSNILTLTLLGVIAFYSLLLVLLRTKIAIDLYPYAIFFIGMASLFTSSLRSWYITGADIQVEFYVFKLTNTHHIWNMAFYQGAFNACLSITILPTILTNILSIQDIYVYKVIFQILFAIVPVLVFFITINYTRPVFAFLSAFFFLSFPTFFNDMPMGNRQEIGFIFFGLVLYIMLTPNDCTLLMRRSLFTIFALSVIVSHYSTNFVLLALVTFVYVVTYITTHPFMKNTIPLILQKLRDKLFKKFSTDLFLSLPLILFIFAMTYVWNNLYTQSSSHTSSVIAEVVNSLLVKSNADTRSDDLSYSIFSSHTTLDPEQQLQEYIQSTRKSAESINLGDTHGFYAQSITDKYPTYLAEQEQLAPTPLGNWLSSFHIPVFNIQAELRSLSASFMQIFVCIGLLVISFFKNERPFSLQYLLLCFGGIFILIFMILLPFISLEYGLLRVFQQLLFILSLPLVLAIDSVLFFLKEQKRLIFTGIIAIFFFLDLTGFIPHLTGDYYPQMTLDNSGLYYDVYYVQQSDTLAIVWLSKNNVNNEPVETDLENTDKLLNYGNRRDVLPASFPSTVRKNTYVYLKVSIPRIVVFGNYTFIINSDKSFLDDNKNLVYSNGKDNVYR